MANKGLRLHAYVIMTSHFHAIISTTEDHDLVATIRDMKKFMAKSILRLIATENESRKEWMLNKFAYEAKRTKRSQDFVFWQEGYHAKQLVTSEFQMQKLDYIHQNPVVEGWVSEAEHFLYSSASNYADLPSLIDIDYL